MKTLTSLVLTAALAAAAAPAPAAPTAYLDNDILVVIESPGDDISGIGLVQGYALSKKGAIDYVTWSVDGEHKGFVPYGGSRGDVAAAYPGHADSKDPGFATAWNYNHFTPGEHEIVVRAYDDKGGYNEAKRKFNTTRFGGGDDKFIKADELELPTIPIAGLRLYPDKPKGDLFDVELVWLKASQQYVIKKIEEICTECDKLAYGAPTLDSVKAINSDFVDVKWSGGSPVIAYVVERRDITFPIAIDDPWDYAGTVSGVEQRFVDEIPPYSGPGVIVPAITVYEYRVRGLGPSDKSDWSNRLDVTMP